MYNQSITTLDEFILREQTHYTQATGELSGLLRDIGLAAKLVNREVNTAGLANIIGNAGEENTHGETVQKLDLFANDRLLSCLRNSGECCGMASEEMEDIVIIDSMEGKAAKYVVLFDPLDGSSNIDVNVSIGTIFSIFKRKSTTEDPCDVSDFLQVGSEQVAAGYVIYGTSTIFVYTTGNGVNGFTLDPSIGEFCLSHKDIKIPADGNQYAVNQGNYLSFDPSVQNFIDHCISKGRGLRYIGSMVADVHRILLKGGIFMYPGTNSHPNGKLRLMYECNPLAMIIEQAGGKAINQKLERILGVESIELHQKATIFIGSEHLIDEVRSFVNQ